MNRFELSAAFLSSLVTAYKQTSFPVFGFTTEKPLRYTPHMFSEGVGLRQVCDYAVLLIRREDTEGTSAMLRRLGLEDFARGLAWILMSCFHLPESKLYCTPDGRQGRFIFNEIMRSGNFGQYDARFNPLPQGAGKLRRTCHKARRNFSFVRSYPGEVVWYLPFMAWETLCYKLPHR